MCSSSIDRLDRLARQDLGRVLVDEVVAALDGVVHVPLPVVLFLVAQRGADAALGRAGVRPRGVELGQHGRLDAVARELERRPQAGAAGTDDDGLVVVDGRPASGRATAPAPSAGVAARRWLPIGRSAMPANCARPIAVTAMKQRGHVGVVAITHLVQEVDRATRSARGPGTARSADPGRGGVRKATIGRADEPRWCRTGCWRVRGRCPGRGSSVPTDIAYATPKSSLPHSVSNLAGTIRTGSNGSPSQALRWPARPAALLSCQQPTRRQRVDLSLRAAQSTFRRFASSVPIYRLEPPNTVVASDSSPFSLQVVDDQRDQAASIAVAIIGQRGAHDSLPPRPSAATSGQACRQAAGRASSAGRTAPPPSSAPVPTPSARLSIPVRRRAASRIRAMYSVSDSRTFEMSAPAGHSANR